MLTTTGAKSGRETTVPLLGFEEGDTMILVASNYGQAHHPAWYYNLRAHPRARIAVRGRSRDVEAEQIESPERERYIAVATESYPGYSRYEQRAAPRRIAVFRLPCHDAQSLNRLAFSATVHCLTGCAIGEVLGMIIGTALGWSDLATIALAVVLAFFFGYTLTSWPLLRSGMALSAVAPIAFASDTISITIMEIVDNAIMLLIPGAMEATAHRHRVLGRAGRRATDRRRRGVPGQPLAARPRQGARGRAPAPPSLRRTWVTTITTTVIRTRPTLAG